MPATLILDTMEGTEVNVDILASQNSTRVRTGIVKDIPVGATADSQVMDKALDAVLLEVPSGSTYPMRPGWFFSKLRIFPTKNPTIARVELVYAPLSWGGAIPSTYVIRNRAYLLDSYTSVLPGTRIPLRLGFNDGTTIVPADTCKVRFGRPCRAISVTSVIGGAVDESVGDRIGSVNIEVWKGKAPGFWRLDNYETSQAVYTGYTTIEALAVTKVVEDWSESEILRDSRTHRYVDVLPAEITAMNAKPYSFGLIWPITAPGKGIMRVGLYPMTSFTSIFGF